MHIRIFLIYLILAVGTVAAQAAPTSDELYQQAYDQFLKRDYQSASSSLDQIGTSDQQKPDILNLRGAIYKRLGELDNAANAFNDALKINPKDWVPKFNLAEINFLRGDYKAARTFLQESLAAMPEVDRIQKQDLVLYKVYLTFLLDGEKDKAKLLLDSFDMNSPNPVYYFAQAAWNFNNKDNDKAKALIDTTDGLYSQELRNSYSQALVDVGWMEPLAGVKQTTVAANTSATAAVSASPSASSSPTASSTPAPSPTESATVPLASSNATPLLQASLPPDPDPSPTASATPLKMGISSTPTPANAGASKPTSTSGTILLALLVIATAGIALLFLARRSRSASPATRTPISSAPVKTTAAAEESSLHDFNDEGTGEVQVQDPVVILKSAPANPIPIRPRHTVTEAIPEKNEDKEMVPVFAKTTSTTRKSTVKKAPAKMPALKAKVLVAPIVKAPVKTVQPPAIATTKKASTTKAKPAPVKKPGPTKRVPTKIATKPTITTKSIAKPKASIAPAPVKAVPAKAAKITKASVKPPAEIATPIILEKKPVVIAAPKAISSKSVQTKKPVAIAPPAPPVAVEETVPTINLIPSAKSPTKPAVKPPTKPAAKIKVAPPAKVAPVKAVPTSRNKAGKAVSPLITIPEFEDAILNQPSTVLRVVPNQNTETKPPVSTKSSEN